MEFHFNANVAIKCGVIPAVLLNNIIFWVEKNKANNQNFKDGHYWTYNSNKALSLLFPFLTSNQIRSALDKLRDAELIITANHSEGCDRTLWFTYTQKALDLVNGVEESIIKNEMDAPESISQEEKVEDLPAKTDKNSQIDLCYNPNGNVKNSQMDLSSNTNDTNNKPQIKTPDINIQEKETHKEKDPVKCVFEFWNTQIVIPCTELTPQVAKAIERSLKSFSLDTIIESIAHYAEVVNSDYFMSYEWGLRDFLTHSNAMPKFTYYGEKWLAYRTWKAKQEDSGEVYAFKKLLQQIIPEEAHTNTLPHVANATYAVER